MSIPGTTFAWRGVGLWCFLRWAPIATYSLLYSFLTATPYFSNPYYVVEGEINWRTDKMRERRKGGKQGRQSRIKVKKGLSIVFGGCRNKWKRGYLIWRSGAEFEIFRFQFFFYVFNLKFLKKKLETLRFVVPFKLQKFEPPLRWSF